MGELILHSVDDHTELFNLTLTPTLYSNPNPPLKNPAEEDC